MRLLHRLGLAALAAVTITGCSTQPKVLYHAGDEAPPDFMAGPTAVLLTNVDGFSAKLICSAPAVETPETRKKKKPLSGDLLGREGRLIFQPDNAVKGKRARSEGGTFFIWDESQHAGFILSDPLQAYAPTSTNVQPTNVVYNVSTAVQEEANGHPCRRLEAIVQSSDGSSQRFKVWQAEDAKNFPVRIEATTEKGPMTVNFYDVRMELPSPQLFTPPDGFTKYESPVALMNELIVRQVALAKHNESAPIQLNPAGGPSVSNWRPETPQ